MNEIFIYTSYAMVRIEKRTGEIVYAIIDVEDVPLLKEYHFSLNSKGYAYDSQKDVLLHRLIMDAKEDEFIDHVDNNPLNDTKSNLRKCTQAENNANRKCINKLGISNSIIDCRCLIQVFIFQMSMQSLYLAFIPMLYITKP